MNALKLIDNSTDEYRLGQIVKHLLRNPNFSQVSIATGYWDLPAMAEIFPELQNFLSREGTSLRILLGEEPTVRAYQVKNPSKQDPNFPEKFLKKDLEELALKQEYQQVVNLLVQHMNDGSHSKLQVKVYRINFLHAKCYIFGSDEENAIGIIGSSNFTKQGLFGNLELNQFEDNNATVNFLRKNSTQHPSHRSWFEELWADSEEWNKTFNEVLLQLSKHGQVCYSPYEMYVHALYRIYGQELRDEQDTKVEADDPATGKPRLLKFQVQNANSLIKKLERQGVAMLSDSVGLGKTYTAIKVIEYYMFNPDKNQRVILVCPAGLKSQWEKAFDDFKFPFPPLILSMQDTERVKDVKENITRTPVGLFVFDESHNLRNDSGDRWRIFTEWRLANPYAKTLLLTATPINNQLTDLTNQISMATGGEISSLGRFQNASGNYETLKERIEKIQKNIRTQARNTGVVNFGEIKEQLTPLLNRFIVRRTRQGIEREYPDGLEINGKLQRFPKAYPDNLTYQVHNQDKSTLLRFAAENTGLTAAFEYEIGSMVELKYLAHPLDLFQHYTRRNTPIHSSLEVIYTALLSLGFPCYRYNIYRHAYYGRERNTEDFKLSIEENRELSRQIGIYGIFRTVFLKRLESSLSSINKSIEGYEKKLLDFQAALMQHNKIISVRNLAALNKAIEAYNAQADDEGRLDFDIDQFENEDADFMSIVADEAVFNVAQLKADIGKDLSVLTVLKAQLAFLLKKDDKIQVLAKHLNQNSDRKVLVFTYFADTLNYLKEHLPTYLVKGNNVEFALGSKSEIEDYARRFAPVSKRYALKSGEQEIDFLLATDKLSEGQNLQDCGMIVNYDLHWNPVRMIQRNGRINRLGSQHDEIFIYNFRPEEQLESYLQLVRKLEDKINLIRYTIGTDQSILDEDPTPQDYTEDLYSTDEKKRLEAFQRIFETSELLAAEDLFMDDLRAFDRNEAFSSEYKIHIQNLPKGKWGKLQQRKEDDRFNHLAHMAGGHDKDPLEAGYFFAFNEEGIGIPMTTTEGLLRIKASSEQNERYTDRFTNKPGIEERLVNFIENYQHSEEEHRNAYNEGHLNAIAVLRNKMIEYGYPVESIEQVQDCLFKSMNAYINKESMKAIRNVTRLLRGGKAITSDVIDQIINIAKQYTPEELTEKEPLTELLQVFQ